MTGDTRTQAGASSPDPRDDEIARLLGPYIDRLSAGEKLDRARIEAEHPLHAAELLRELETFLDLAGEHGPRHPIEIGGYRTIRVAGRGGMGVVYEAWDPAMDRQVAVKVLPAEMASDPKAIARFLKEAKIAARLQHPNIVAIHNMGVSGGAPYYVMEMVEGRTLAQALREEDLVSRANLAYFARTAEAFAGAADGLTHAHAKGVVHRDLKPSNLIVDASGRLRILDFGLASLEGLSGITGSHSILGTPLYMSPEAARGGARTLDARSDIYSLGASLYEAVAFEPPFQGKDASDTLARIIAGDPRPPRHRNPRVPLDLETIILKCLEKDPARRYETASELAADLRRFARGEAIRARPRGPFARTARIVWRRRVAVGAAAAVILLASLTALLVAQRRREQAAALDRNYEQKTLEAMMLLEARTPGSASRLQAAAVPKGRLELAGDSRSGILGGVALALEPELEEARPDPLREALRLIGEAIDLCPARPEARYHRARALHAAGRHDEALDAVRPLVDGEAPFAPARVWKAVHLEKTGAGEASASAARAMAAQDGAWEAAYLLAAEARAKGQWKEAAAAGSRLLQVLARGADPYLGAKLEAHLARGRAWLELKEPDEALADFAAAQALAPEAVDPVLLMARTFLLKGMPEAADARLKNLYDATRFKSEAADRSSTLLFDFKSYSRALEWAELMDPSPRRESSRAYCLARLGDSGKALAAARGGVALDERDPLAHYCLGWVLERLHHYDEAADAFRAAIALDSADARFHLGLGRALGRWAYEGGRPEEAHAAFAQALAIDPASLPAMNGLAWMSRALEKEEEAKAWFEKAVAREPKDVAALNGLGFLLAVEKRYDDAIEAFERVLAVDPEIAAAHSNLGWMHSEKGDCDKAAAACARAIELDPEFEKPHVILGCCYLGQGKLEEALAEFEVMAKKNPANGLAHFNQAVTLERLRRPKDAIEAYRRAIGVNRQDVRYFFNLGNLLRDLGRFDDAIAEYEKALALEGGHDMTHNNLGLALLQAERPEDAAPHFAEAIRIAPQSSDAYFNLATVLAGEGKLDEAIAKLSAGLPHAPRDPRPLRQLAAWKAGLGDFAGAIAACEQGVEIVDALLAERPQSRSLRGELLASLDLLSEAALKAGDEAKARGALSRALGLRKEAASRSDASVEALNDCAWSLLECGIEDLREPATALEIARRAAVLTEEKDAAILDTLALALFRTGDSPAAVAAQRRAVALLPEAAPDTPEGSVRAEMETRLRQFEAAAGKERP